MVAMSRFRCGPNFGKNLAHLITLARGRPAAAPDLHTLTHWLDPHGSINVPGLMFEAHLLVRLFPSKEVWAVLGFMPRQMS
jgi:hypothetical protein